MFRSMLKSRKKKTRNERGKDHYGRDRDKRYDDHPASIGIQQGRRDFRVSERLAFGHSVRASNLLHDHRWPMDPIEASACRGVGNRLSRGREQHRGTHGQEYARDDFLSVSLSGPRGFDCHHRPQEFIDGRIFEALDFLAGE